MGNKLTKEFYKNLIDYRNNNTTFEKYECLNYEDIEISIKSIFNFRCEYGHEWTEKTHSRSIDLNHRCPECNRISNDKKRKQDAYNKIKEFHNNEYEYPYFMEEFKDNTSKITIACKEHGNFTKTYKRHFGKNAESCPICTTQKTKELYSISSEYLELFSEMKLELTNVNITVNEHQDIKCLICNNTFNATPKSKVQNYKKYGSKGCPECNKNNRYTQVREYNLKSLENKFNIIGNYDTLFINRDTLIKVQNKNCGHIFESSFKNLLHANVECGVCNIGRDLYNLEQHYISQNNKIDGYEKYLSEVNFYTERNYNKYMDIINPDNKVRSLLGNTGYQLDHIISKRFCFDNNISAELCSDVSNLQLIDNIENNKKGSSIHLNRKIPEIFNSYFDDLNNNIKEIKELLCSIVNTEAIENYIDNNFKINLYYPKLNMGIVYLNYTEYNYNTFRRKNYFSEMKTYFNSKNINVIMISEHEWKNHKVKTSNKIKHIFNGSEHKIHARKCELKLIESKIAKNFLNENHIQGSCVSSYNIGAYFGDELLAVMTFGNKRKGMVGYSKLKTPIIDEYELLRFSIKSNYIISGIANRLLKYFTKIMDKNIKIISYADRRWSNGNMYYLMGFTKKSVNSPSYYYIDKGVQYSRMKYQKHIIKNKFPDYYDDNLSESTIMAKVGNDFDIFKIYDAGSITFEMICNSR